MKKIFKYHIGSMEDLAAKACTNGVFKIHMAEGSRILNLGVQNEKAVPQAVMWAESESDPKDIVMNVTLIKPVPTGGLMPPSGFSYIGTLEDRNKFIWHIYACQDINRGDF